MYINQIGLRIRNTLMVTGLLLLAACASQPGLKQVNANASLTGAIYTTDSSCGGTNVNLFVSKDDVYLNGGPNGGSSGLPDGLYYARVTAPSVNNPNIDVILGKTLDASVEVSGGKFVKCYQLSAILYSFSSGFTALGYDDTPNGGGVYKVWVSKNPDFLENESKTDNFKVDNTVKPATLTVQKFYDANVNGKWDSGESEILGWKVNIADGVNYDRFTKVNIQLAPDTYTVSEYMPLETNWLATTSKLVQGIVLGSGDSATVIFGNVCLGKGGGLTLGFWSNNNGKALFGADDLALMISLNLRNANGSIFDPTSYAQFRSWLLSATATNMAYMLSAQLAAMELNVLNGFVSPTAKVYVNSTLGFMTVQALMAEANTSLGTNGYTVALDSVRSYQEALKNALDKANNNLNFVQSAPCSFNFN